MSTKFSQFSDGNNTRISDTTVGLRGGNNSKFSNTSMDDDDGNPLLAYAQTSLINPNVNYLQVFNNVTTAAPGIAALGSDLNINLNLTAKGTGHVEITGTGALGIPSGTTGQRPIGFAGGLRYNSTTDFPEYYSISNGAWEPIPAASGTISAVNGTAPITASTVAGVVTVGLTTPLAGTYGGTGVANTGKTITLGGNLTTSGAFASTFTMTNTTSVTFPTSGTLATTADIPSLPLSPTNGGTGVSNPTAHGVLIAEGASAMTPIVLGAGQVLIGTTASDPVAGAIGSGSGILVGNSSGAITVSNTGVLSNVATANQTTVSGATGNVTIGLASNAILPGTGGVTLPSGNTAARAGGAGTMRFNSQTTVFEATVDGATWATIETSAIGVTSVSGTSNRITASPTTGDVIVDIAATYVGQTSITTLGTITTGVWNGTAVNETHGGTNQTTYATGDTLYASAANTLSKLTGNITTTKQYLSQTGTGAVSQAPAWATISGTDITGAALTASNDTNITLTLGGTPTTALLRAASITAGWTGQLSLARGGTNADLSGTVSNGGIVYSTATAMAILAGTATARQMLQSGASTTPAWSTTTWPATTTANRILYSSSTSVIGEITSANSAVLVTNSSGAPAFSSTMTNGQVIIGSTGATPTAATLTQGTGISITNGAGTITIAATGTSASGALIGTQTFKSSGTYTPTAGTGHVLVKAWGAGGGSGASNTANPGGAGGGGAYVEAYFANSTSQTITIGTGGTGATANAGSTATDGGSTSFASTLVAAGGSHGVNTGNGGAGGTIAGSTVPSGGLGMPGCVGGTYQGNATPCPGGGAFGNVPKQNAAGTYGIAGIANSGQGGDGGNNGTAGGNGGDGLMIIYEYS